MPEPDLTDPASTGPAAHVEVVAVMAGHGPRPVELARRRRGLLTSLAVLVPSVGADTPALVRAVTAWAPPEFRVEVVVVDPGPDDPVARDALDDVADHLDALAWPWASVPQPILSRAEGLDAAVQACSSEFVITVHGRADHLADVPAGLGHLWAEGADVLIADGGGDTRPVLERVAAGLGLRAGGPDTVVVLRRWVARFLLGDLALALDPGAELLERCALLDLTVLDVQPRP
ncbi:MAG: hypothetical protein ACOYOP_12080 [Microthrixaceae bacterium]